MRPRPVSVYDRYPALPRPRRGDPGPPCSWCGRATFGDGTGGGVIVDGQPIHPWCVPEREDEAKFRRRTLLGFQRRCRRCGAAVGEPCVTPSGQVRRYVTRRDDGHHRERTR